MKSLPQFIADLLATSELLIEQANDLKELAQFFGAATATPVPAKSSHKQQPHAPEPPPVRNVIHVHPAPPPIQKSEPVWFTPPEPPVFTPPEPPVTVTVTPEPPPVTVQVIPPKEQKPKKTHLTPDQKASIRRDWEAIPPQLRHRENRAALAAKYGASSIQIYAITRDQMELVKNLKGGQGRYQNLQQTSGGQ